MGKFAGKGSQIREKALALTGECAKAFLRGSTRSAVQIHEHGGSLDPSKGRDRALSSDVIFHSVASVRSLHIPFFQPHVSHEQIHSDNCIQQSIPKIYRNCSCKNSKINLSRFSLISQLLRSYAKQIQYRNAVNHK